jgi:hypothetical protein
VTLALYVLAGIVTTATWTQLDAIGLAALLPIVVVFAIERWPSFWQRSLPAGATSDRAGAGLFPGRPSRRAVGVGVAISAPLLVHLVATLDEEFPFGGDEGYHLSAARTFARHLVFAAPWLVATAAGALLLYRKGFRYVITATLAALWVASLWFPPEMTFARYPAAFYFLAAPLHLAGEIAGVSRPHVINHVVNAASVPIWLFLLRPLVLRRWPDAPALVAGLLLFFHPAVLTYFGSGNLEPWALVLILLALEAAATRPVEERWIAVLLAGAAAWIKEPAVLLIPIVWSVAMTRWRAGVPGLLPGALPLGLVAAAPFVTYYFVRQTLALPRFYGLASMSDLVSLERARQWLATVRLQSGDTGMVLLAGLAVFAFAGFVVHRQHPGDRFSHAAMMIGAALLVVFFYVDRQGVPFTGYGRYLLFPLVAAGAAVMLAVRRLSERGHRRVVAATAAIVFACQLQPLARTLALDFAPDYRRNSMEWHRSLIRLPFRELASRIPEHPDAEQISRIRFVTVVLDTFITRVAYPDLARAYEITARYEGPGRTDCRCTAPDEAVIAGFEYRANFDRSTPADPVVVAEERACVTQVKTTCRHTSEVADEDGVMVGILGIGVR